MQMAAGIAVCTVIYFVRLKELVDDFAYLGNLCEEFIPVPSLMSTISLT